ncbi:MAG: hypothetical protein V1881_00985 [Candidatus Micrarchaeota archaeon]
MNWKALMLALLFAVPFAFAAPAWKAAPAKNVAIALKPAAVQPGFDKVYSVLDDLEARNISTEKIRAVVESAEANMTNASRAEKILIAKEVNGEWRNFRKEALKQVIANKTNEGMTRAKNALEQLKTIRAKMVEKGLNTRGVDNAISRIERNILRADATQSDVKKLAELKRIQWELQYAKLYIKKMLNRQEAPTYRELGQAEVDAAVQPFADSASQAAA